MNILKKFNEEKKYISLIANHRNLKAEARKREDKSINDICDYIEQAVKTSSYKKRFLNGYRRCPDDIFIELAQLSIMIKALDAKSKTLMIQDYNDCEMMFGYSNDIYKFNDEIEAMIDDIFGDFRDNNGYCEAFEFFLLVYPNPGGINTYVQVSEVDISYTEDYHCEDKATLDFRYERAIRAIHNFVLENKEEIEQLLQKMIDNGDVA